MKRNLLLLIGLCMAVCVQAQKKNFSYKFYGQVRGDLFYNSRANAEIVDGLFHLYPKDVALDADGKDLNASPNGSFYLLYSRLGIDVLVTCDPGQRLRHPMAFRIGAHMVGA